MRSIPHDIPQFPVEILYRALALDGEQLLDLGVHFGLRFLEGW